MKVSRTVLKTSGVGDCSAEFNQDLVTRRKLGRSVYNNAPAGSRLRHPHVYLAASRLTDMELVALGRITSVVRSRREGVGSDSFERQARTMPFIQTHDRLSEVVERRYELTWAYSPLQYQPKPTPIPVPGE